MSYSLLVLSSLEEATIYLYAYVFVHVTVCHIHVSHNNLLFILGMELFSWQSTTAGVLYFLRYTSPSFTGFF